MANSSAVSLKEIKFSWSKDKEYVLDIGRLDIPEESFTFLRGPSGSGKTTLLNLIGGVTTPSVGELRVLGHEFHKLKSSARDQVRADDIGFIFQMFNLIPYLSAIENVELATFFSSKRAKRLKTTASSEATRLLGRLGIPARRVQAPVNELSVGQQQRVAAARAFLGRPSLLIADEPTSSLDSSHKEEFIELLKEECSSTKTTLIFVSHDPSLERNFDQVIDLVKLNRSAEKGGE